MIIRRFPCHYRLQTPAGGSGGASGSDLLDDISNVEAAFSMRRLFSSYSGNAIRLREDSGDTEADIGFDTNGDLDLAAATAHLNGANGYIVTWYDQSGNDRHYTQGTAANQPSYNDCYMNDWGALRFNGLDQWLDDSTDWTASADDWTVAAMIAPMRVTGEQHIFSTYTATGPDNLAFAYLADTDVAGFNAGAAWTKASNTPHTGRQALSWLAEAASSGEIRVNTVSRGSSLSYSQTGVFADSRIGRDANGSAYFDGYISELIVVSAPLDGTMRDTIALSQFNYFTPSTFVVTEAAVPVFDSEGAAIVTEQMWQMPDGAFWVLDGETFAFS